MRLVLLSNVIITNADSPKIFSRKCGYVCLTNLFVFCLFVQVRTAAFEDYCAILVRSFQLSLPGVSTRVTTPEHPARGRWNCGREMSGNFAEMTTSTPFWDFFFTCRITTTWDRRLYFPSEGRRAEDFFRPKIPTALAGCEPANLVTKGQQANSRPPKPLDGV